MNVKYPPKKKTSVTWEIYAQEQLIIPANEAKTILLSFGVMMSSGMVLTSLKQELNSNTIVTIDEGTPLCYIHYLI